MQKQHIYLIKCVFLKVKKNKTEKVRGNISKPAFKCLMTGTHVMKTRSCLKAKPQVSEIEKC